MRGMRERDRSPPTESDDAVLLLSRWECHSILGDGIDLSLHVGRVKTPRRGNGRRGDDAIRARWNVRHREKVWSNRNESIGGQLVGDASDPWRQSIDLLYDDYHWCFGVPLGIHNPAAQAVIGAGSNHHPFSMSRRCSETRGCSRGVRRWLSDGSSASRRLIGRAGDSRDEKDQAHSPESHHLPLPCLVTGFAAACLKQAAKNSPTRYSA